MIVPAGATFTIDIPDSLRGKVQAAKVMCWEPRGWHYGNLSCETMRNHGVSILARHPQALTPKVSGFGQGDISYMGMRDGEALRLRINDLSLRR